MTEDNATPCCGSAAPGPEEPSWFAHMLGHCLDYAREAHAHGRPIVGIMCEYTPRELILAAGAVPVCLCGGSAETIPAAEQHLPANLCPLIKSTYGFSVLKSNPFLEMAPLIVAETTCDGKKKMYERLGERYPMYVLELPQKPLRASGLRSWEEELQRFKAELETRFSVSITDERLREAIGVMNTERRLRRALAELMKRDRPPLTGRQLLALKSSISGIPAELEALETTLATLGAREGPPEYGERVRVLMTGVPMVQGAEWVLELVEQRGGLVVCLESCTGVKPILDDVREDAPDPVAALAEKYYHLPCSVMSPNEDRLALLRRLARDYRADCIVDLVWQACLTYDVESYAIKRLAEDELGLPFLHIGTDYSVADSARVEVRVDALFESVRPLGRSARGARPGAAGPAGETVQ